ncbi:MAG: DUF6438 domain-containing protein [Janthinobacterium lividum]
MSLPVRQSLVLLFLILALQRGGRAFAQSQQYLPPGFPVPSGYLAPGQDDYASHILIPPPPLRISADEWGKLRNKINPPCGGQDYLPYVVHISTDGQVGEATLLPYEVWCNDHKIPLGPPALIRQHLGEAEAQLRKGRFRPWVINGHTVQVAVSSGIAIAPPEKYGQLRPFPSPVVQASVLVIMQQMGCEGKCPSYRMTLHGDGTLEYEGFTFVAVAGKKTVRIDPAAVANLVRQFEEAKFFSALPEYRGAVDGGETLLQISVNGKSHTVNDALGLSAGLPTSIRDLEWSIKRIKNVRQWVYGAN